MNSQLDFIKQHLWVFNRAIYVRGIFLTENQPSVDQAISIFDFIQFSISISRATYNLRPYGRKLLYCVFLCFACALGRSLILEFLALDEGDHSLF